MKRKIVHGECNAEASYKTSWDAIRLHLPDSGAPPKAQQKLSGQTASYPGHLMNQHFPFLFHGLNDVQGTLSTMATDGHSPAHWAQLLPPVALPKVAVSLPKPVHAAYISTINF